jgi:hypothetical protein
MMLNPGAEGNREGFVRNRNFRFSSRLPDTIYSFKDSRGINIFWGPKGSPARLLNQYCREAMFFHNPVIFCLPPMQCRDLWRAGAFSKQVTTSGVFAGLIAGIAICRVSYADGT